MPLPLPKYLTDNIADNGTPNLSLKYYKRADVYKDINFTELIKDKGTFFSKIISLSKTSAYKQAFETRKKLIDGIGVTFTMTTATRLVFGMGYEHPTEIGFMFDWTTGLPIIPGSSLKGVARCAAEAERHECLNKIFGAEKGEAQAGEIIFFPAYPCLEEGQEFLEVDVMTPHYTLYYSDKKGKTPPADYYSPVPLHFLTVPAEVQYCFRLAHRKNLMDKGSPLLKDAVNILKCALAECGVGAKTAVSYGYFKD